MLECHSSSQGGEKKHPRALTAQLCMSHQCPLRKASTGNVSVGKTYYTKKAMSVGGGGSSGGQWSYFREELNVRLQATQEIEVKKTISSCTASYQTEIPFPSHFPVIGDDGQSITHDIRVWLTFPRGGEALRFGATGLGQCVHLDRDSKFL